MTQRGEPDEGLEATIQAGSEPTTDGMAATTPASIPESAGYADTIPPDARPERISRYIIRGVLGRGGMGVVYIGYDANLEREVAIKLVRAEAAGGSDGPTRLKREARIMAQLSHPNLVTVHEVGEHEGQVFVAMELVKGLTLRRWLRKQEREWRDIVSVYLKAAQGLAAAHKVGVIHRDFKPDNVMVADDGRVRVLDFGLARPVDALPSAAELTTSSSDAPTSLTVTGAVMGTPAYMPPEQHEGKVTDARADQFSYCVALFEALYGGRPFVGSSILELASATTSGVVTERPANTKVPRKLHDALLRGLERDPNNRYSGMDQLIGELEHRSESRGKGYMVGGAVLGVAAVLLGVVLYRSGGSAAAVDETCKPVATMLDGVWDRPAQQRLEGRFATLNKPYAQDVWLSLKRDFNAYVGAWTSAQGQICEQNDRRDRLLRAQQLTCLDDHMLRMRAHIGATANVDVNTLALSFEGLNIAKATECLDAQVARARPPAAHGDTADAVDAQRMRIYTAQTHIATHRFVKHSTLTPHLLEMKDASEKLKKIGHGPAHAESLFYLGRALGYVNKTAQAKKVLEAAIDIAETNRADTTVARLLIRIVHLHAFSGNDDKDVTAMIKRAETALKRAGNPAMPSGQFLHTRAHIANLNKQFATAVTLAKKSHTEFAKALPPQSYRLALIESDLARFAGLRKQRDVRLAHLSVAIDSFERFMGRNHPRLGPLLARLAQAHYASDDTRRSGLSHLRRAIRLLSYAGGHPSPLLGRSLVSTAETLQQYGRTADAFAGFELAIRALEPVFPRSGYAFVAALAQVGDYAWHHQLDAAAAEKHAARSVDLMKKNYPAKNLAIMRPQLVVAEIRLAQARYEDAAALANAVLLAPKRPTGYDAPRPHRFVAAGLLARIRAEQKRAPAAFAMLKKMTALAAGPREQARAQVVRGHVALSLGRSGRAIQRYAAAVKSGNLSASSESLARGYLAVARARAGQHTTAITELSAAVSRDPDKGHPLGIMARVELAKLMWSLRRDRAKAKDYANKARRAIKRFSPRRKGPKKQMDKLLKLR